MIVGTSPLSSANIRCYYLRGLVMVGRLGTSDSTVCVIVGAGVEVGVEVEAEVETKAGIGINLGVAM
jgi:hypothetical protein